MASASETTATVAPASIPGSPIRQGAPAVDSVTAELPWESGFGQWRFAPAGVARFRPRGLADHLAWLSGLTPCLRSIAGYPVAVRAQALFVLNRYLCGGVALRTGGGLSWPQVLLAHCDSVKRSSRIRRKQSLPAAALPLALQHRQFIDAVDRLKHHPLRLSHLLRAQTGLCPDIPVTWRGRLRWADAWVKGSSIADAKFVATTADEIPAAVDRFIADCNALSAEISAVAGNDSNAAATDGDDLGSALQAERARADLGFAAYMALLGWHPFSDGNGRVARALYQAVAGGQGESTAGALFAAAHLLMLRCLQPQLWGQSLWRAQRGLSHPAEFLDQCREAAAAAASLCEMLLDGLRSADPHVDTDPSTRWWQPCPLVRVDAPGRAAVARSGQSLSVTLPGGKSGAAAQATIAFLMAYEHALHDCVAPQQTTEHPLTG